MQIILISDRLAKARSVTLSLRHLIGTAVAALILLCASTVALYWLTLRYAAEIRLPVLQQLVLSANEAEAERGRVVVYAAAGDLASRGLGSADLVPGCQMADEATAAELLAGADAALIY